jgi:hypothetical protein
MPMNDTAVNASFVSQTMEGLFDQDPQILAVAQTIISNQGNRSITEVARQLRNLIGSPKTNERTRPGGQGFWIHRQGAEFAPGEKKFYTKLARLLQAEAFSDE